MLGLERLELRHLRFDLLMCYEIIYNHVDINRDCFFTLATVMLPILVLEVIPLN